MLWLRLMFLIMENIKENIGANVFDNIRANIFDNVSANVPSNVLKNARTLILVSANFSDNIKIGDNVLIYDRDRSN